MRRYAEERARKFAASPPEFPVAENRKDQLPLVTFKSQGEEPDQFIYTSYVTTELVEWLSKSNDFDVETLDYRKFTSTATENMEKDLLFLVARRHGG